MVLALVDRVSAYKGGGEFSKTHLTMMGVAWKVAGESYATILRLCNTAEVRSAIRAACEPKRKRKEKP